MQKAVQTLEADFLVVGGGIAGPALACGLARFGYRIIMLEKNEQPLDTARGDHLQPYTVEVLQRWRVRDDFEKQGAERRTGAIWYMSDGSELLNSSMTEIDVPYPYFLFLNHEKIGETLLAGAARNANFRLLRPIRNWWLEEYSPERLVVRIGMPDGSDIHVRTRIIVGADGRNSRVRKTLGLSHSSFSYRCPIGVMFGRSSDQPPGNPVRVYLGAKTIVSVIPRTGGMVKIGIPVERNQITEWRNASSRELQQRLMGAAPCLKLENIEFADVYPPIYLMADEWVKDQAVLVGDACHAMHPSRSQGMNVAIRCIDQLVRLIRDEDPHLKTPARILSSYQSKVKPAIDLILKDNHRRGLEFESLDEDKVEAMAKALREIQKDPQRRKRYALNAAGYGANN